MAQGLLTGVHAAPVIALLSKAGQKPYNERLAGGVVCRSVWK